MRRDVLRALVARGWSPEPGRPHVLTKADAVWVSFSGGRESGLDGGRRQLTGFRNPQATYTITFPPSTPARVIVAACEAAVTGGGR